MDNQLLDQTLETSFHARHEGMAITLFIIMEASSVLGRMETL